MANESVFEWAPTSVNDFNWTTADCAPALHIWESFVRLHDYPLFSTIEFLRHGLTGYWSTHNFTAPPDYELLGWFMPHSIHNDSDLFGNLYNQVFLGFVYDQCGHDLCNSWLYEGNSDQAGRGVCSLAL